MKKIIAAILALAMTLSLSVTVFADDHVITEKDGTDKDVKTEITTSIEPTYSVTIPSDINVDFNETSTYFGAVQLNAAQIELGHVIKVTLDAGGSLKNEADNSNVIDYTINDSDGEKFISADYTSEGQKTDLTIDITKDDWEAANAGKYSDTVTFNVSYVEASAS